VRAAVLATILASLFLLDRSFYKEQQEASTAPSVAADVLTYLQTTPAGTTVLSPSVLVPTLHYYHPELPAIGYDIGWTPAKVIDFMRERAGNIALLCVGTVCRQLTGEFASGTAWIPLGRIADDQPETLYAIEPGRK
jgi:hypothetical protein